MASVVQDAISKFATLIETAVSGATTLQGTIDPININTNELPHFQLFAGELVDTEQLPWRQYRQNITFSVIGTVKDQTQEQMWTIYDLIETRVRNSDARLSLTVLWCRITASAVNDHPAKGNEYQTLLFFVECEVIRVG